MKHLVSWAAFIVLASPVLAADNQPQPVTADDVGQQVRQTLQAVKNYSFEQKDEYQKRLQAVLPKLDQRIDNLKRQAEQASGQAKEEYRKQIPRLQKLRARVQDQLARVQSATPGAWQDIKTGVGAAVEDLQKAFESAKTHFQQSK